MDVDVDVDADVDVDGTTNDTSKSKLQQVKSRPSSNDTKFSKESQERVYELEAGRDGRVGKKGGGGGSNKAGSGCSSRFLLWCQLI